jgi:hypothetical protein
MRFEHPTFLFALFLLVLPILIHLFSFRRYKVLYFSSLQFLKNIEEETKHTRKLKHLLVLISRLLALAFLIIAFAQPYIPAKGEKAINGESILAIYIDNSFSMTSMGTNGTLFSESKEQARKFIENAPASSKILLVSNELSAIEEQACTKNEALNRLDRLNISPVRKKMSDVVSWMKESISNSGQQITRKQLVLLSDFQQNQCDIQQIRLDSTFNFYPIQVIPQEAQNISIDSIWFNDPNFKTKVNNELNIKLSNQGNEKVEHLELQLSINETKRTVFVSLEKKQIKTIQINYSDLTVGSKLGHIHISDKYLHFDDDFYFSYEVRPNSNILLISGNGNSSLISKTYHLDTYYRLEEVKATSFLPSNINNKQLIVVNDVQTIHEGMNDAFIKFVQQGGSLLLFPGKEIHLASWNKLLNNLQLPQLKNLEVNKSPLKTINYADPFFQGIFEKNPEKLTISLLRKIYTTTSNSFAVPLITLQNNATLFTRNASSFLFSFGLDTTFGSFTSNALFPSCLLRTAELSQQKSPMYLTLGTDTRYPVKASNTEKVYHIVGEGIDFIPYSEQIDFQSYVSLLGNSNNIRMKQGMYSIQNEESSIPLAINFDRTESNISYYSEKDIKQIFESNKIENLHYSHTQLGNSNLHIELEKPYTYWRIFLLLSLLLLITEMALLKFMR